VDACLSGTINGFPYSSLGKRVTAPISVRTCSELVPGFNLLFRAAALEAFREVLNFIEFPVFETPTVEPAAGFATEQVSAAKPPRSARA
jgi:hypothetical protein